MHAKVIAILGAAIVAVGCGGGSSSPSPNVPPIAKDQSLATKQDVPLSVTLTGADADGDALTFAVVTPPAHGALDGTAPILTYVPISGFSGSDRFTFTVTDGRATSGEATVSITVVAPTGEEVLDLRFGQLLTSLAMRGGVSVAVAKEGALLFANGYGYADPGLQTPFTATLRGRIASISKMTTMAAAMHLVEQGQLSLDDRLLDRLPEFKPPLDSRAADITLRHLLSHAGGWYASGEPLFLQSRVASELGIPSPPSCADVFRWTMQKRYLDFAPGSMHAYSSVGFCALGLVVEKVAGRDLQGYVRDVVLAPMGVHAARFGGSRRVDLAPGEVTYLDADGAPPLTSVFPSDTTPVPAPYAYSWPTLGAAGGWVFSAVDLTRFLNGLEGRGTSAAFLSLATIATVTTVSWPNAASGYEYGLGITIRQDSVPRWWGHNGRLWGTFSAAYRSDDGWAYAVIFNSELNSKVGDQTVYVGAHTAIVEAIAAGFSNATDLYGSFPSDDLGPYSGL